MFQPCFLTVVMMLRRMAKFSAPCADRKSPEIFWRSFVIRRSRSASLSPITDYSRFAAGPADTRAIERKMPE